MHTPTLDILNSRLNEVKRLNKMPESRDLSGLKRVIADDYGIAISDLEGPCREPHLMEPRKMYAIIARNHFCTHLTLREVGNAINRSHCSTLYYLSQANKLFAKNPSFRQRYERLLTQLLCKTN